MDNMSGIFEEKDEKIVAGEENKWGMDHGEIEYIEKLAGLKTETANMLFNNVVESLKSLNYDPSDFRVNTASLHTYIDASVVDFFYMGDKSPLILFFENESEEESVRVVARATCNREQGRTRIDLNIYRNVEDNWKQYDGEAWRDMDDEEIIYLVKKELSLGKQFSDLLEKIK